MESLYMYRYRVETHFHIYQKIACYDYNNTVKTSRSNIIIDTNLNSLLILIAWQQKLEEDGGEEEGGREVSSQFSAPYKHTGRMQTWNCSLHVRGFCFPCIYMQLQFCWTVVQRRHVNIALSRLIVKDHVTQASCIAGGGDGSVS